MKGSIEMSASDKTDSELLDEYPTTDPDSPERREIVDELIRR